MAPRVNKLVQPWPNATPPRRRNSRLKSHRSSYSRRWSKACPSSLTTSPRGPLTEQVEKLEQTSLRSMKQILTAIQYLTRAQRLRIIARGKTAHPSISMGNVRWSLMELSVQVPFSSRTSNTLHPQRINRLPRLDSSGLSSKAEAVLRSALTRLPF